MVCLFLYSMKVFLKFPLPFPLYIQFDSKNEAQVEAEMGFRISVLIGSKRSNKLLRGHYKVLYKNGKRNFWVKTLKTILLCNTLQNQARDLLKICVWGAPPRKEHPIKQKTTRTNRALCSRVFHSTNKYLNPKKGK